MKSKNQMKDMEQSFPVELFVFSSFLSFCNLTLMGSCELTSTFVAGNIAQTTDDYKLDEINSGGEIFLTNQHGEVLTAKYVVITVPLTILKDGDINFIPALPASKKKAIDAIQMRGALKIVCRFKSQFWPDTMNLIYSVRGFVSQIWMYSRDSPDSDKKCHVIAGFQTAKLAEEKIGLSGKDVLDGFLKQLDEIFT